MEWKKVENSRNQIKKAGKYLAKGTDDIFEEQKARDVLDNWRAAHAYPLQVIASNLRRRTKDRGTLVVQRLKRMDSIIAKLKRQPWISLYDMQDLSGCRVIAPNVSDVYSIAREYQTSNIKHKLHHIDDYISKPKASGYRGIHMVYRYHSDKNEDYVVNFGFIVGCIFPISIYERDFLVSNQTIKPFLILILKKKVFEG